MNTQLHYDSLASFNRQYRTDLLDTQHLDSGKKHFRKFHYPNMEEAQAVDFWGYVLRKGSVRYLVDFKGSKPKDKLPIVVKDEEMVSYKGEAYQRVTSWSSARFRSEKRMSFRDLVDALSAVEHSNKKHYKLLLFMALAQYLGRANFRVCSPPGTGKDNSVQLLQNLVGDCTSVNSPTMAKLESLTSVQWLVINEMMKLTKSEWERVEQFLLDAGAMKPTMEKHSRSYKGSGESFDISELSLSIFYNDVTAYPEGEDKYFDSRVHAAVQDRFPAFRVHGGFTERFDLINRVDVDDWVSNHMEDYKHLIYTLIYYKDHMEDELVRYDDSLLHSMLETFYDGQVPQRHRTNILSLLKPVDLYCESQEEFDAWITVIVDSLSDYQAMLEYPSLLESAKSSSSETLKKAERQLRDEATFKEKNKVLRAVISGEYDYQGSLKNFT